MSNEGLEIELDQMSTPKVILKIAWG